MTDLGIFTFHLVEMPVTAAVRLLRRPPQADQVAGLRYAECLSLMRLGAPTVSPDRLQLGRLAMFARWDGESALDDFLGGPRAAVRIRLARPDAVPAPLVRVGRVARPTRAG